MTAVDRRGATASAYTVPTDRPEADGTLGLGPTTMVVVQVRCGDDVGTGWTYGPRRRHRWSTDPAPGVVGTVAARRRPAN